MKNNTNHTDLTSKDSRWLIAKLASVPGIYVCAPRSENEVFEMQRIFEDCAISTSCGNANIKTAVSLDEFREIEQQILYDKPTSHFIVFTTAPIADGRRGEIAQMGLSVRVNTINGCAVYMRGEGNWSGIMLNLVEAKLSETAIQQAGSDRADLSSDVNGSTSHNYRKAAQKMIRPARDRERRRQKRFEAKNVANSQSSILQDRENLRKWAKGYIKECAERIAEEKGISFPWK